MTRPLTIEECEAAIKGEEELRSFNSRKSERETPTFIERIARAYIELRAAHDASQQTIREFEYRLGLIGAACVADDINEAYHQFYMAIVKDLNLPAEEQERLTRSCIDAARSAPEPGEAESKGGSE